MANLRPDTQGVDDNTMLMGYVKTVDARHHGFGLQGS